MWCEAVGRASAAQTRLVSFRGGVLVVEVSSSALAHELGVYYKRELLGQLRERAGVPVEELRCRVSGHPQGSGKGVDRR